MDLTLLTKSTKDLSHAINRNSPTILTGLGVAGLLSTIILTVKATINAQEILYQEGAFRAEKWSEQTGEIEDVCPDFDIEEKIRLVWKCYIPTILTGASTIVCMIGSTRISLRRNAALASLLSIAETTFREYQAKVVEEIGKGKSEKITDEISQDKLDRNPVDEKTVVLTGKGNYLCYDSFSGRYFRSDIETLQKAANEFNQKLLREGWLSINEFYYEIGLESIDLGDEMGWIAERSLMAFKLSTKISTDGEPCLVIGYTVTPHHI
jgi:hypothetical protein